MITDCELVLIGFLGIGNNYSARASIYLPPDSFPAKVWPEAELKRRGYVGSLIRCQQGYLPALILEHARESKPRFCQEIRGYGCIVLGATLRKELAIHFPVSELDPNFLGGAEPVVARESLALSRPPDPCAHQLAVVGVPVYILKIVVEASVA